jgi:hypothetical protein
MPQPVRLDKAPHPLLADRLVVLVPEYSVDAAALGRIVRDFALHNVSKILLLSVVQEPFGEVHMAHVLGYLYAMTHDPFLHVETEVRVQTTWIKTIRELCHPGDLILCLSDHKIKRLVFWEKALSDEIAQSLNMPVYVLPVENGARNGRLPNS